MEKIDYEKMEQGDLMLVLGRVRVTFQIIPEPKIFFFGVIGSAQGLFRTWIAEDRQELHFTEVKEKLAEDLAKGEEEAARLLTSLLGNHIFTIRDILKEERQTIFQKMVQEELKEHRRIYAELFDKSEKTIGTLIREGFEIPYEIRVAAEVTLSDRLLHEVEDLSRDFKGTLERGEIDKIIEKAREYGLGLKTEEPTLILSGLLKEKMENLQEAMARYQPGLSEEDKVKREKVEEVIRLLDLAGKWGFKFQKEEAQHLMDEMLKEYVWVLEKSWWGEGVERPFPSNLILLADKLDFNVERFTKVIHPAISIPRS